MITKILEERGRSDEDILTGAMINLRNTPGPFGVSPDAIAYGCELRSLLPVIERRDPGKEMPENLMEFWTSPNRLSILNGFVC